MNENNNLFKSISDDLDWFEGWITMRADQIMSSVPMEEERLLENAPPCVEHASNYKDLLCVLEQHQSAEDPAWMPVAERLILVVALAPHIRPRAFSQLSYLLSQGIGVDSFGGLKNNRYHGFIPTGETVLFLLAGDNLSLRQQIVNRVFSPSHVFSKKGVLDLYEISPELPRLNGMLRLSDEYQSLLLEGKKFVPALSTSFPAQLIETQENWEDLVVSSQTRFALEEINIWLKENQRMMEDEQISRKIKRGYRALFYGASGTGKTMAAALIGKDAGVPVFRIDLSVVVSKYIGETEKNLAAIFDKAENRDWILFFDEADALFGKRTQTTTANDRYANQEVSYLLQRIENFNGLVILSSNLKSNIDAAFTRRFQTMIKFSVPNETLRKELFDKAFQGKYAVENVELLDKVVKKYELTGAEINNIFRYCAMMSMHHGHEKVTEQVFSDGVIKELRKKGKAI